MSGLTNTMSSVGGLIFHSRIPPGVIVNDIVGAGQVQTGAAWNLPDRYLGQVKHEINALALEPGKQLIGAMKESRVLAIGELHDSAEGLRHEVAAMMKNLQQAGATHLLLEMPITMKPALDKFLATGIYDVNDGSVPHDKHFYLLEEPAYRELLLAAKSAGLAVQPLDMPDYFRRDRPERNEYMARGIKQVLEADAQNKVIFWGGNNHLNNTGPNHDYLSLAGQLRDRYKVTTVWTELDESDPLVMLSAGLKETVAIRPCETQYVGAMLSANPAYARDAQPFNINDLILIVPVKQ